MLRQTLGQWLRILPLFALCVLFPAPAHAYLDPGTGNILIYVAISLAATALYFIKSAWYALLKRLGPRREAAALPHGNEPLVIFSEGKIYWFTFKHIVERLIAQKYPFRYLSMDVEDPGLAIESSYMNSRYIGDGAAAFARAAGVCARVMLQTTPNIGTPGYPMSASRHVDCLAHILHGVGGVAMYHKYALDACDVIFLMGDGDRESIRLLEKKRGLKERECISGGLPYLDELARSIIPKDGCSDPAVILVAPSWGGKNCLGYCGTEFIFWLADAGYQVIIRPHPFSMKKEKNLIDGFMETFSRQTNVCFDLDVDGGPSLAAADLMISDKSGVRFDFAFLYERPVLTLDVPMRYQENFEISELEYVWENDMETKLGPVLSLERFKSLGRDDFLNLIRQTLGVNNRELTALRDKTLANFGRSGSFIADWAMERCRKLDDEGKAVC